MSNEVNQVSNVVNASFVPASSVNTNSGKDFMAALTRLYKEPERVVHDMVSQETTDLGDFGVVQNGTSEAYMAISIYLQRATTAFQSVMDSLAFENTFFKQVTNMVGG
jgi:hypothetical protein